MARAYEPELEMLEYNKGRPPERFYECVQCCGEGGFEKHIWVYEHGCGFGHDDSMWVGCEACGGTGGFIDEAEGDRG